MSKISAIFSPTSDVSSDGFSTKVLPAANASATFFVARIRGKLKGAMPATTPNGRRIAIEMRPGTSQGIVLPHDAAAFAGGGPEDSGDNGHFKMGLAEGRSGFLDQQIDDFIAHGFQNIRGPNQNQFPLGWQRVAPNIFDRLGGVDSPGHVFRSRHEDFGKGLAAGRIDHRRHGRWLRFRSFVH